ncbi:hypothetical protein A9Q98_12430 [Thalassotalea sp. 42_200_T64]|nr:hypothetical protein A9Q98_12430 [Thalassotalea sp. 42_200_T64]
MGGKLYKLHSYVEETPMDRDVNITPFTDLIISNAAQQVAKSYFDDNAPAALDSAEVAAQETALQEKLQDVFDALGLDAAINLINSSFSADHSGLDAALDIIDIETDAVTNVATITNLINGSSIEDNVTDTDDNDTAIIIVDAEVIATVTDIQAIASLFDVFAEKFAAGLPTAASIDSLFASEFLHDDQAKNQFLTDITTDPSVIGINFLSVSIRDIDSDLGTAIVDFNVEFNGVIEAESETWQVNKDSELGWQLLGNQLFFEADTLTFHCNDNDGTDENTFGCGLNVSFYDNDFANNGTNGAPIASATMSIIDGSDAVTVKDIVYLGNAEYNGPGELSVYNQSEQNYQGDYASFGNSEGEVDPSIFVVGDIIRYQLYTGQLDISQPPQPMVRVATEVASFEKTLLFTPATSGLYPALTAESISALANFTLDQDLTVAWTLQPGTTIDTILVIIDDNQGNHYDVEDESISAEQTSTVINSSIFAETLLNDPNFDQNNFTLLVRVYSIAPTTGQFHSTDYRQSFVEIPASNVSCDTESPWNDATDKPTVFYSTNDFKAAIADCATQFTLPDVVKADLAGITYYLDDEHITFDASADNFVLTSYGVDEISGTVDDETYYGVVSYLADSIVEFAYSATQGGPILGRDLMRIKEQTTFNGKTIFKATVLWEFYEWAESDGDNQDESHAGAELYTQVYAVDADFDWDAWYNQ